jgi:hypothetical protein
VLAVETTQWVIAIGSLGSALVALALALGLKDWFFRPRLRGDWIRSRPELDGRLLQPSNQLASEPDLVDVFPYSDRIVDLASVDHGRASERKSPIFVEISHPWPPNEANILDPRPGNSNSSWSATTSGLSARSSRSRMTGSGRGWTTPQSGSTSSSTGRTQSHRDRQKTRHEIARHREPTPKSHRVEPFLAAPFRANEVRTSAGPRASTPGSLLAVRSLRFAGPSSPR